MPDKTAAPAVRRFDEDVLDNPVTVAAFDAVDEFLRAGSDGIQVNLRDFNKRVSLMRAYLRCAEETAHQEASRRAGMMPS